MTPSTSASRIQPHLRAMPQHAVRQGDILELTAEIPNASEAPLLALPVKFIFPKGVRVLAKTATINGRPARTTKATVRNCALQVPMLTAGATYTVSCKAVLEELPAPGEPLLCEVLVAGVRADATFDTQCVVEFSPDENYVEPLRSGKPGMAVPFGIVLTNTGTAPARSVHLGIAASHLTLDNADIPITLLCEGGAVVSVLDLGEIPANTQQRLTGMLTLPYSHDDTLYTVPITLRAENVEETPLGALSAHLQPDVDLTGSFLRDLSGEQPLLYGDNRTIVLTLCNAGLTRAIGVQVVLDLPSDMAIVAVRGAEDTSDVLRFEDIDAGCMSSASVHVRYAGYRDDACGIRARVRSDQCDALELEPLAIPLDPRVITGKERAGEIDAEATADLQTSYAAHLRSDIDHERRVRVWNVLRQFAVDERLGLHRHEMAMRVLIADSLRVIGNDGDHVGQLYDTLRSTVQQTLNRALLQTAIPGFTLTPEWLAVLRSEDIAQQLETLLVEALPYIGEQTYEENASGDIFTGTLPVSAVQSVLSLQRTPVWTSSVLPLCIPTTCHDSRLTKLFRDYVVACGMVFTTMQDEHDDATHGLDRILAEIIAFANPAVAA